MTRNYTNEVVDRIVDLSLVFMIGIALIVSLVSLVIPAIEMGFLHHHVERDAVVIDLIRFRYKYIVVVSTGYEYGPLDVLVTRDTFYSLEVGRQVTICYHIGEISDTRRSVVIH